MKKKQEDIEAGIRQKSPTPEDSVSRDSSPEPEQRVPDRREVRRPEERKRYRSRSRSRSRTAPASSFWRPSPCWRSGPEQKNISKNITKKIFVSFFFFIPVSEAGRGSLQEAGGGSGLLLG